MPGEEELGQLRYIADRFSFFIHILSLLFMKEKRASI